MKHKPKLVNIGRSTYFHHRHGVVQQKKRFRVTILYASLLLVIGGVFFTSSQFALPAIKRLAELQKQHNVGVNTSVLAEPDTKPSLEIRKENDALKELLEEKLSEFPDNQTWGIYMYDLQDSATVNINSDKVFPAGSLYKLYLLEALESKLPFDRWQYTWTDDGINVEDCVQSMLQVSDDACAEQLADYIGWGVISQINRKNGFKDTSMSGLEGRSTTPANTGELLIRLQKGQILSDNARRFVFDALYQQPGHKGISKGCNDCRTADKLGEMSNVANDAGIVTHGGHSYVLVILSQGGTFKQIAELTKTIETR